MSFHRFKSFLDDNNLTNVVPFELSDSTHTAEEAAKANNVEVRNIVKSLFLTSDVDEIIVLVPGDRRLDLEKLSAYLGVDYELADADTVKLYTGYSIGGVPPFGHTQKFCTYIISGFDKENELVAAAGSAKTVFKTSYQDLVELCDAVEVDI